MNSITLTSESSILQFKKRAIERLEKLDEIEATYIKMDGTEGTFTEYAERSIKELCELLDFSLMQPKPHIYFNDIHVNVSESMFRLIVNGEL